MSPFLVRAYHPLLGSPQDPYSIYAGDFKEDEEKEFVLEEPKPTLQPPLEIKKETVTYSMKTVTTTRFVPLESRPSERQPTCLDRLFSLFCCCMKKKHVQETSSTTTLQLNAVILSIKEPKSPESIICLFDPTLGVPNFNFQSPWQLAQSSETALKTVQEPLKTEIFAWRNNMIKDTFLPSPGAVVWFLTQGLNYPECRLIKLLLLKKATPEHIVHLTPLCKHVLHHINTEKGSPIFTNLHKSSARPPSPTFDLSF
jgi:hypothetical protein